VPDKKILFVGSHGTVHGISRMQLVAVTGKGRGLRGAVLPGGSLPPAPAASGYAPASLPKGSVDLLPFIDVSQDSVAGIWRLTPRGLLSTMIQNSLVQVPYAPPEEYDLEVVAELKEGGDALGIGLPQGANRVMMVIGSWGNQYNGLRLIDGKYEKDNDTSTRAQVFVTGKPSRILYSVRRDKLEVVADGRKLLSWKIDFSRATPGIWTVPEKGVFFVSTMGNVHEISRMVLTPVGGTGRPLRGAGGASAESGSPLPKGTIDLLALVDPVRDSVSGEWSLEDKTLVAKSGDHVRLMLPVLPPDEYDLRVVLERREGNDGIVFGLARGSNQWTAFVDKLPTEGGHTGLEMVDNQMVTLQRGMQIRTGQPATFDFRVRKNGITALMDGKPLFSWQGNTTRLANYKNWAVPNPKALFLGQWWNTVRYLEVKLTSVSGEGRLLRVGQTSLPKNAVDLLAMIDPQKDAVKGEWVLDPQGLICQAGDHIRLQIPYSPPDEYDLHLTASRRDGSDGLLVGLVKGTVQWSVTMDTQASGSFKTGFEAIDGQGPSGNPTTHSGPVFVNGQNVQLEFRVRKAGVTVLADGKPIIDWRGNFNRLSLPDGWKVRSPNALFLAAWGSRYHFSRISLVPVTGTGRRLR
jgi:hypothetical protein